MSYKKYSKLNQIRLKSSRIKVNKDDKILREPSEISFVLNV